MKKWFKSLNRQAKIMLLLIILLTVCIIVRWQWISNEAGSAVKSRFERVK